MNFESRMSDLNHLGHDNLMNSSTSTNIYDNSLNKFPLSPILNSSYDNRDDQVRNNLEMWRMEMDRKVSLKYLI